MLDIYMTVIYTISQTTGDTNNKEDEMRRITLIKQSNGWYAQYEGDEAAEMTRIMGSPIILTAYTASADASVVIAALEKLNPGYIITVG